MVVDGRPSGENPMTTRRSFIKSASAAAAGIVFCGCGLLEAAHAQQPSGRRLAVVVNGKRIKTIDVHSHCHFREIASLLGDEASILTPPIKESKEAFIEIEDRFKAMDAQGVDIEVLSINPFWYGKDRDFAGQIVKIQNEKLAELCAANPDRFAAFASLTLQAPDLAVQELEIAIKKQGLRGAAIGDVVNGAEFSDPKFHPVWAKAEELGAVLFIHPSGSPELTKRLSGNGWLANTIGNPLGTTIALSHLIFEGTLDRFPGLKIIGAHGGGYLPSYADRSDHACSVAPAFCNPNVALKKEPTEYLKQLYFDSIVFSTEAIRHLVAQVGVGQIVMGSDYPYQWELHPVDRIFACTFLSDDEKSSILSTTAAKLLNIRT
jgi:predicted TIM-barrel fold metal-dependent hydrolase